MAKDKTSYIIIKGSYGWGGDIPFFANLTMDEYGNLVPTEWVKMKIDDELDDIENFPIWELGRYA